METVFDALKAMGKATSVELAARLDISREEVLNELWELKKSGFVDKSVYTWRVADNNVQQEQPARAELPEETTTATVTKISESDLTTTIEQRGPQTADELATLFGTTSRKVASTLAMAINKGRLIRVNQNGKYRYCIPDAKINDMSAQSTVLVQVGSDTDKNEEQGDRNRFSSTKKHEQSEEAVTDIVQSLPSFTEKRMNYQVLPSLHMANRELRRAKSHVQKWERVCAALRELNKHRDIMQQITTGGDGTA
ncbi:DUF1627 domain-containing protein [Escherichia coli]|nr:DUF1627 domain-containing protein [Escherichia coli]